MNIFQSRFILKTEQCQSSLTEWMFKIVNKVLNGIHSLNLCILVVLNQGLQNRHSLVHNMFLDLFLGITINQTGFQIGENDISNVKLVRFIHVLEVRDSRSLRSSRRSRIRTSLIYLVISSSVTFVSWSVTDLNSLTNLGSAVGTAFGRLVSAGGTESQLYSSRAAEFTFRKSSTDRSDACQNFAIDALD